MQKLKILWYKIWAKVVSSVVNIFASQTNFDVKNTVLLIGSARSGTTFLMESLNSKNEYRIIFEPFNRTYTKEWKEFKERHYIDPNDVKEDEKQIVTKILQGNINSNWVDQYNRKIRSTKRLIKTVRANLMLDFIEKEFPEIQILYLHRNPFDVVASRINLNFDPIDVYLILEREDFLSKYYSDINIPALKILLNSPESCHAALWCFENRFILKSLGNRKITEARYEDIIGKTITLKNDKLEISNKTRRQSVSSSLHASYQLSEVERQNISEVLDYFGMKEYYT